MFIIDYNSLITETYLRPRPGKLLESVSAASVSGHVIVCAARSIKSMWSLRYRVTKLTFGSWVTNRPQMGPRPTSAASPTEGSHCDLWPPPQHHRRWSSEAASPPRPSCVSIRDSPQQLQQQTNSDSSLFSALGFTLREIQETKEPFSNEMKVFIIFLLHHWHHLLRVHHSVCFTCCCFHISWLKPTIFHHTSTKSDLYRGP